MNTDLFIRQVIDAVRRGDTSVLSKLSSSEQVYIRQALREIEQAGRSPTIDNLWSVDYEEKPVSPRQFLTDEYYLGKVGVDLWPKWMKELEFVLERKNEVIEWILSGAIGTGKTMVAVIAQMYRLYELLCMKNPQKFCHLAEGSSIIFGFFNIFKYLAYDTSYKYFKTYVELSSYFKGILPRRASDQEIIELPKQIGIAIGARALHALGQNIFGGLLDEANFGREASTKQEDIERSQVGQSYLGVRDRMDSRFMDPETGVVPGLLCIISSRTYKMAFLERHIQAKARDPHTHVSAFSLYEVKPGFEKSPRFRVMLGDRQRKSKLLKADDVVPEGCEVIEVPEQFRRSFEYDLESAIQNIAGRALWGAKTLIPRREVIFEGIEKSTPRAHPFKAEEVVLSLDDNIRIEDYFMLDRVTTTVDRTTGRRIPKFHPAAERFIHIDLSKNKDCAGLGMGCVSEVRKIERTDELGNVYTIRESIIFYDFLLRIRAAEGSQVDYAKIEGFIHYLKDVANFRIARVSADQYQSVGTLQKLHKAGISVKEVSVDRTPVPYLLLKNAHMEMRVDMYYYPPYIDEITTIQDLIINGQQKIDHPEGSSKDVSDAAAGVLEGITAAAGLEQSAQRPIDPRGMKQAATPVQTPEMEDELLIPQDYGKNPLEAFFGGKTKGIIKR